MNFKVTKFGWYLSLRKKNIALTNLDVHISKVCMGHLEAWWSNGQNDFLVLHSNAHCVQGKRRLCLHGCHAQIRHLSDIFIKETHECGNPKDFKLAFIVIEEFSSSKAAWKMPSTTFRTDFNLIKCELIWGNLKSEKLKIQVTQIPGNTKTGKLGNSKF